LFGYKFGGKEVDFAFESGWGQVVIVVPETVLAEALPAGAGHTGLKAKALVLFYGLGREYGNLCC
jgi:hypothetical protein